MKKLFFWRPFRWLIYTIFLFIFQLVYFKYSHGVNSLTMSLIYLPALLTLILSLFKIANRLISASAWTAIIGLGLHGIFQIAGTGSPYMVVYIVVTIVFGVLGVLLSLLQAIFNRPKKHIPRHLKA